MDFRNLANQISDVGLPQLLTLNSDPKANFTVSGNNGQVMLFNFWTSPTNSRRFSVGRKKQKQRHEFKAGLKSLFSWREIEREETMRMIELKQDAYQISMCWCLFALGVFQNMQHIGMSEHEAARKSPLAEIQLKKSSTLFLSLSSVFFPLIAYTALKCKESICLFSRCSHLTTVEKGCLLDCLHLPKNMKWSVCITEMLRMYDGDGFQFGMAEWKCEREKT